MKGHCGASTPLVILEPQNISPSYSKTAPTSSTSMVAVVPRPTLSYAQFHPNTGSPVQPQLEPTLRTVKTCLPTPML